MKPYTEKESVLSFGVERRDMDVSLGVLLESGMEFTHEYDFGTTPELSLRVADLGYGDAGDERIQDHGYRAIRILARNESPEIECEACAGPRSERLHRAPLQTGGEAWLCGDCTAAHSTGDVGTARTVFGRLPVGWWVLGAVVLHRNVGTGIQRDD